VGGEVLLNGQNKRVVSSDVCEVLLRLCAVDSYVLGQVEQFVEHSYLSNL